MTPTGPVAVEGALVTWGYDVTVMTDSNGFFNLPDVYESDGYVYVLDVNKDGYRRYTSTLDITGDTSIDVRLIRR
jgi:hypothetical protein